MLRNNDVILKNGDNIFKSQVVDSYLNTDSACIQYPRLTTTGLSVSEPLYAYYKTPTATLKNTYTTDMTNGGINFGLDGTTCVKDYYFCGNTNSVIGLCGYDYSTTSRWRGSLSCLMEQFPNLEDIDFTQRETAFNDNMSYSTFPENLCILELCDKTISGDITTINNFGSPQCWCLACTQFSGNFSDVDFNNSLQYTYLRCTPTSMIININDLLDNNSGYTYSCLYRAQGAQLCADTVDVSSLTYIGWCLPYSNIKGTWSSPDFNTDLTHFNITTCCVDADLTNWDISDTKLNCFAWRNNYGSYGSLSGDLSGWTFPSTMRRFGLCYAYGVTAAPSDWGDDITDINLYQLPALSGDVTTWIMPSGLRSFYANYTDLDGNLENFDFSGFTTIQFRNSNFYGDIGEITIPTGMSTIYLDGNNMNGNVAEIEVSSVMSYIDMSYNDDVYMDLSSPYDTCNLYGLYLNNISGVTGSFSNLTVGNNLQSFCAYNTPITASLSDWDYNNIRYFYFNCTSLSQDITTLFTGDTSNIYTMCFSYNTNLSGDTSNWAMDDVRNIVMQSTALSGRFCHSCPYCLSIGNTNICSCIDTDFDFSVQSYNICMANSNIQGNLSGVTLNNSTTYQFMVNDNSNLYGADSFTDYIFINRKNFSRSYISFNYSNIGDYVSGVAEVLGDLGTYGGDVSGMDLTEEQVNNLVAGTDWDGSGANTPWDERSKIWWMKNACVSSSSSTKRYSTFNIFYSYS